MNKNTFIALSVTLATLACSRSPDHPPKERVAVPAVAPASATPSAAPSAAPASMAPSAAASEAAAVKSPEQCTKLRTCCQALREQYGDKEAAFTPLCQMMWMQGALSQLGSRGEDPRFCEAQLLQLQPLIPLLRNMHPEVRTPVPDACRHVPRGLGAMPGLERLPATPHKPPSHR